MTLERLIFFYRQKNCSNVLSPNLLFSFNSLHPSSHHVIQACVLKHFKSSYILSKVFSQPTFREAMKTHLFGGIKMESKHRCFPHLLGYLPYLIEMGGIILVLLINCLSLVVSEKVIICDGCVINITLHENEIIFFESEGFPDSLTKNFTLNVFGNVTDVSCFQKKIVGQRRRFLGFN